VQNNIIVNGKGPSIIETGGTAMSNIYRDNLVYGGNTSIQLSNGLSAYGTINADPQFVNNTGTASGDYDLQASSPARGTGLALAGIATDFLGTPRPQSGATDIGACLFDSNGTASGGPTTTGPVAAGISASARSIIKGQSSILTWTTKNAVSANLNGTAVALNGSLTVYPTSTTTYRITAINSSGATDWGQVPITVK